MLHRSFGYAQKKSSKIDLWNPGVGTQLRRKNNTCNLNIPKLHSARNLGAQMKYNNVIGTDIYFKRERIVLAKLAKIKS